MSQLNETTPEWVWISIRCGDGSLLLVSRDGKRCQLIAPKLQFVSDVHPVEDLSLLREIMAKEVKKLSEDGLLIVPRNVKTMGLLDAHSKLEKKR